MRKKTAVIQVAAEPILKIALQKLADEDHRKLSDYVRIQLLKLPQVKRKVKEFEKKD